MKFSGNVLNRTGNKWSDFGNNLDHLDPGFFLIFMNGFLLM